MIKNLGTVKIGVYLSREQWEMFYAVLTDERYDCHEVDVFEAAVEDMRGQLASPSSWISGAKEQG